MRHFHWYSDPTLIKILDLISWHNPVFQFVLFQYLTVRTPFSPSHSFLFYLPVHAASASHLSFIPLFIHIAHSALWLKKMLLHISLPGFECTFIFTSLPFPNIPLLFPSLCLFLFHLTFISAAVTPTLSFLFNPSTSFHLPPSLDTSAATPTSFLSCSSFSWLSGPGLEVDS